MSVLFRRPIRRTLLQVGQMAIAIGKPFGLDRMGRLAQGVRRAERMLVVMGERGRG